MNPHRLTWTIAYHFPVAQYVGVAILLGLLFTKDREKLPMERETILMLLLWGLFTLTSFFAVYPDLAWNHWERVSKILLMTFITIVLFIDRQRLRYLLLVIAFSVGFFGVKGAIFSIWTGGAFRVYGPPGTFLADNNDLALALLMIIPILFFLAREEKNAKLKLVFLGTFFLSTASIIFTYSRGGLIGLSVLVLMFLGITKRKFVAAIIVVVAVYLALLFVPAKWFERMETITDYQSYQQEGSIRGRLNAWRFAWNLALDRPFFGGGFEAFKPELFEVYAPAPWDVHDAHSIYFEILGEHGFIALGLFLALLASAFFSLRRLKKRLRDIPSAGWLRNYCDMLQLSLGAYIVSGAFLGRAYFDLFYHLIAMIIILKVLARREYALFTQAGHVSQEIATSSVIPGMARRFQ